VSRARDVVYKVVSALRKGASGKDTGGGGEGLADFERILLALHYADTHSRLLEHNLKELAYRTSLTLCRFTDLIPADLAFWEAGIAAKDSGDTGSALVLLNRYIDLSEALDEGERDTGGLEDKECAGAGFLAPGDFPMPSRPFVSTTAREAAKTWVLATSMDRKGGGGSSKATGSASAAGAGLAKRQCDGCGGQVPACALQCPACTLELPACVITGAPIAPRELFTCKGCGSKAAHRAWEALIARTGVCVWCGSRP
jgi:intraflagellar transport protein 172